MDMRVHNCLACGLSHIHPYVVTIGMQIGIQLSIGFPNKLKRGLPLILAQLEEAGSVAEWND
jgi:hypothetical protein